MGDDKGGSLRTFYPRCRRQPRIHRAATHLGPFCSPCGSQPAWWLAAKTYRRLAARAPKIRAPSVRAFPRRKGNAPDFLPLTCCMERSCSKKWYDPHFVDSGYVGCLRAADTAASDYQGVQECPESCSAYRYGPLCHIILLRGDLCRSRYFPEQAPL